jgi:prefoldin subunit 5
VQERLAEAFPEIQKVVPDLPEANKVDELEKMIKMLQESWTQLTTFTGNMESKLQQSQQEAE